MTNEIMDYPQIIAVEPHQTRAGEFVVLGREDNQVDGFFTRRAHGRDGSQFLGHYRLTFGEAFADFEERKTS
jgi:hypothetical protein